jgi:hypothetical protein
MGNLIGNTLGTWEHDGGCCDLDGNNKNPNPLPHPQRKNWALVHAISPHWPPRISMHASHSLQFWAEANGKN